MQLIRSGRLKPWKSHWRARSFRGRDGLDQVHRQPRAAPKLFGGGWQLVQGIAKLHLESLRVEAIAIRLEAIASRVEAIAIRLEAIASRVEAIAIRLEAISSRLEAVAIIGWRPSQGLAPGTRAELPPECVSGFA